MDRVDRRTEWTVLTDLPRWLGSVCVSGLALPHHGQLQHRSTHANTLIRSHVGVVGTLRVCVCERGRCVSVCVCVVVASVCVWCLRSIIPV